MVQAIRFLGRRQHLPRESKCCLCIGLELVLVCACTCVWFNNENTPSAGTERSDRRANVTATSKSEIWNLVRYSSACRPAMHRHSAFHWWRTTACRAHSTVYRARWLRCTGLQSVHVKLVTGTCTNVRSRRSAEAHTLRQRSLRIMQMHKCRPAVHDGTPRTV